MSFETPDHRSASSLPAAGLTNPGAFGQTAPSPVEPDWEDRIDALGVDAGFWSTMDGRCGAFVDWPGCPLIIELLDGELVVRGRVGSGGDHCPDIDADLDDIVSVELGDLHLDYVEPNEEAWLVGVGGGHLAETCSRVAALVPGLALELQQKVELEPPVASFTALLERGPF